MKRLFSYLNILFGSLIFCSLCSCQKFVTIPPPPDQAVSTTVFADDNSAISAAVGLYSEMTRTSLNFSNGALTLYPGLSSDEMYRTAASSTIDVFTLNEIPSNSSIVKNNFWTAPYNYIYQANAVLEGLEKGQVTDSIKAQLSGEAKFIRAFCHFYLLQLFGEVPLVVSTDYSVNASLGRASIAQIYTQITTDLLEAKNALKESYPTTGRLRPNKWTAASLLARVFLYQKDWQKAEAEATAVIQSGLYSLAPLSAALSTSGEVIWLLGRDNANTAEGATFIPSSATVKPTYAITDSLLAAFTPGDGRKTAWLKSVTIGGTSYVYPYKYRVASGTPVTERLMVFRLAELYLIRAEARAESGNLTGALADVNVLRKRAGLVDLPSTFSQAEVREAVQAERRVELFAEWGHRWFDLKRTGRANAVLSVMKPVSWQPSDERYPIPLTEIESNPFLTQNPGY